MSLNLPRLLRIPLIDADGRPSVAFQNFWQTFAEAIEANDALQEAQIEAIEAANAAATAANEAAATAQTAADEADTAATALTAEQILVNSYITGVTVTATDAGSDATINITAHTRNYGDGSAVSVNAGSITGLSYATFYYIYYDDADRSGGVVPYEVTTDDAVAVQSGARHVVGSVTTPAAAAGDTGGGYVRPPGVRDIITA